MAVTYHTVTSTLSGFFKQPVTAALQVIAIWQGFYKRTGYMILMVL